MDRPRHHRGIAALLPAQSRPFPIHPTDRLIEDFHIDDDEIEDIACIIAARAGYSLENSDQNPLYGQVITVADLTHFFIHQPTTRTT